MEFYFIRHGQSQNNALYLNTGSEKGRVMDPKLTEAGQRQAELLANYLARPRQDGATDGFDPQNLRGFGLTHLYASLMTRAVATGMEVSRAIGLPLQAWEATHETGGIFLEDPLTGELVGQPGGNRVYYEEYFPGFQVPENLGETGWWNRPFEVEADRPVRAQRFVDELLERHGYTNDRVAVVSHGGFYNHMLHALLDLPEREGNWFLLNNTAITRLDIHPLESENGNRKWRVTMMYHNRAEHLPPELIS